MDYQNLATTAGNALGRFGTSMILRVTTPGEFDPSDGEAGTPTITDYPCAGLILPASKGTVEAFDIRFSSRSLIEKNLRAVKLAASGLEVTPQPGHQLIINGETWNVEGATPLIPDGVTPLFYTLGISR